MKCKPKVCLVTTTRAEYGLMKSLIEKFKKDENIDFSLVVSGMHLSPEFGLTKKYIESDGLNIDDEIEILLSSDSSIGVAKSMGLAMISFADTFRRLNPNLIILLGDRSEVFAIASVATVLKIPIAHISGGDLTEGAYDDVFRHSITKMSYLHFTTTDEYRNRVIQLGENPQRVFNFGNLGVENVNNMEFLSRQQLNMELGLNKRNKIVTVIFHPVTLEEKNIIEQLDELLSVINQYKEYQYIFIKGNSDNGGRELNEKIESFIRENKQNCLAFSSLSMSQYLSLLNESEMLIGNSSSGIVEAPSFKIPTINIGDRQKGRVKANSVIDVEPDRIKLKKAFEKAVSDEFKSALNLIRNPYDGGNTSDKIFNKIKNILLNEKIILKKRFYNLKI